MFIGRQGDTSHLALCIISYLCCNFINRHRLKNRLHGLLRIHGDCDCRLRTNHYTLSILPLLKTITEVLRCFQRYYRTLLKLFHVRLTTDISGLNRWYYLCIQGVFRHLRSSTDQLSLNNDIRDTH